MPMTVDDPMPTIRSGVWRSFALCRGTKDLFFPNQAESSTAFYAKEMCRGCPVAEICLLEGLVLNEDQGIRAGLGSDQWRRLRSNHRKFTGEYVGGAARTLNQIIVPVVEAMRRGEVHEWVRNRNTAGATCGHSSTSNRGCLNPRPNGKKCVACASAVASAGLIRNQRTIAEAAEKMTPEQTARILAAATKVAA